MTKAEFYRNARTDLPGPMASVRVVEATTTLAGPLCAATLADLGADVIMFLQLAAKADIVSPWHRRCVSPSDLSQRSNTGIRIDIVCAQKRGVCGSNDFKRSRWNSFQNQLDTDLEKFALHICSPWHRRRVSPSDFNQRSNPGIRIDVRPRNGALRDRRFDLRVVPFRFCIVRARHPGTDRSPKEACDTRVV